MSDEEFEAEKQALITKKLEKPKQLIAFSKKLLYEIDTKQYNFERDQIEVQALQKLTKDDVIAFFKTHIYNDSSNRKKLSVCILSKNSENEVDKNKVKDGLFAAPKLKESKKIEDINHFKDRLGLYPLPEPFIDVYKIEKSKL